MSESNRQSKFSSFRVAALAVIAFALFGAGSRVEATTVVPMDVAELSDQAELVFTGTALKTRVVLSEDGEPYTFVTFAVHDLLKGWTMERQIDLRFSGGETEITVDDQNYANDWVDLGTYSFSPSDNPSVSLSNLVGAEQHSIWADAVMWVPVEE